MAEATLEFNNFVNLTGVRDPSDANTSLYVCPAGFTAVVMLGQVTNSTQTQSNASLMIHSEGETYFVARKLKVSPDSTQDFVISGKLVITVGEQLHLESEGSNVDYSFSILETQNV